MKTNETYTICITYSKNSKNQTPTRHSCYQQGQGKWVKKILEMNLDWDVWHHND